MRSSNHLLVRERERHNWSQKDLAEQLGTTVASISRWERYITAPSPYYRRKLCDLFAKAAHELGLASEQEPQTDMLLPETPASLPSYEHRLLDPAMPLVEPGSAALIGRERLCQHLRGYLSAATSVALYGLPGVGKTALALSLVEEPHVRSVCADGVLWAGLGPTPNVLAVLSRWGRLLGVSEQERATLTSVEAWAQVLRMMLAAKRYLLVIDDTWELEAAFALKVGGPQCAYLLTTRFPPLATAFANKTMRIAELDQEDGIKLLTSFLPALQHDDRSQASQLVRAVGALPLALVVMGKYLRLRSAEGDPSRRFHQAVETLKDVHERLRLSLPAAPADRPPNLPPGASWSVETLIAISEHHLSTSARQAFAALSVFPAKPESFSEEAAIAVMGERVESLDALVDAGLVEMVGHDRYTLHQTIADYARTRVSDHAPRQRLMTYVVQIITSHRLHYRVLEREQGIILHALERAYTLEPDEALIEATQQFVLFLVTRGLSALATHLLSTSYQAAHALQKPALAIASLLLLAKLAEYQGTYTQARIYVRRGLEIARQAQMHQETARLLLAAGVVEVRRGHYRRAEEHFRKSLALIGRHSDPEQRSTLLMNLGWAEQNQGNYEQAEEDYRESLQIMRTLGTRERLCALLLHLGDTVLLRGNILQAEAYYQEGLERARGFGQRASFESFLLELEQRQATAQDTDVLLLKEAAVNEADVQAAYWDSLTYRRMDRFVQHRLTLACQMGYQELLCRLLAGLATVARYKQDDRQAERACEEGLRIARELGDRERCCTFLLHLGETALKHKRYARAEQHYREGLALARQMNNVERTTIVLFKLAEVKRGLGDDQRAEVYLQEGRALTMQQKQ